MADRVKLAAMEQSPPPVAEPAPEVPVAHRRRWPWIAAVLLIVAVAGGWWLSRDGRTVADEEPAAASRTGDVVRADLVEVTSYAGTLGRVAGDPVTSSLAGTVTWAAEPGDVVAQGDVLFEVNGEPVVLLFGDGPAYRPLASSEGTVSVTARRAGTVTGVAAEGQILQQGDIVAVIGDVPTFVMYGDTPVWRTLREDVDEGPDVRQLEQALVDLGYDPSGTVTVDEDFTGFTEDMVERWQEDVGIEEDGIVDLGEVVFLTGPSEVMAVVATTGQTVGAGQTLLEVGDGVAPEGDDVAGLEQALTALGFDPGPVDGRYTAATRAAVVAWQASLGAEEDAVVDLGEVVFLPAAIRISDRLVTVGSAVNPGTPVLAATGSEIRVTMQLPAEDQGLLAEGDAVTIELPDNSVTPGTVESVDTVATVSQQGDAVFEVIIVLDDPAAAGGLDEAPVDVDVVTDRVDGAMAVPVTALLALAEGGYAVEVVDASGNTRLVAVDPGFYADGLVEVESAGLSVGDEVVLP